MPTFNYVWTQWFSTFFEQTPTALPRHSHVSRRAPWINEWPWNCGHCDVGPGNAGDAAREPRAPRKQIARRVRPIYFVGLFEMQQCFRGDHAQRSWNWTTARGRMKTGYKNKIRFFFICLIVLCWLLNCAGPNRAVWPLLHWAYLFQVAYFCKQKDLKTKKVWNPPPRKKKNKSHSQRPHRLCERPRWETMF